MNFDFELDLNDERYDFEMADIDMLYGGRQNENNEVIATNNDLLISEALSTAPLSQNVPTQDQFIGNIDDMNSTPIEIDQMLLAAVVRPPNEIPQTEYNHAPTRIVQHIFPFLTNIPILIVKFCIVCSDRVDNNGIKCTVCKETYHYKIS